MRNTKMNITRKNKIKVLEELSGSKFIGFYADVKSEDLPENLLEVCDLNISENAALLEKTKSSDLIFGGSALFECSAETDKRKFFSADEVKISMAVVAARQPLA
jgi:hypothetical protein